MPFHVTNVDQMRDAAVRALPDGASDDHRAWISKALIRHVAKTGAFTKSTGQTDDHGSPAVTFDEDEFRPVAIGVRDFLHSCREISPTKYGRVTKASWEQIEDGSQKWHEALAKPSRKAVRRAARIGDGPGVSHILDRPDGKRWVRLESPEALDTEGVRMGHCVGRGSYDKYVSETPPVGIYSLRNRDGDPELTVEVRRNEDGLTVEQACGRENVDMTIHQIPDFNSLSEHLGVEALSMTLSSGHRFLQRRIMTDDQVKEWIEDLVKRSRAGETIPPIKGDLDLRVLKILELPDGLTVGGSMDLRDCTSLTHLPNGLTVGESLHLTGCTSLTHLPNGLTVGGSLNLRGCTSLTHLPEGLTVGEWLDLHRCTLLTGLPEGLTVGGWLNLHGCTSLTHLPEALTVVEHLDLQDCTSLTHLPEGLTVGGSLYLRDCTSLTHLPDGLTVGGMLDLGGCTSLTHLPDGLTVGGYLDLGGCTSLTHLPEALTVGERIDGADHLPRTSAKRTGAR
jgi:hypothetical protein